MSNKVKRGFVLTKRGEYMLLQLKAWRPNLNYSELVEEGICLLYKEEVAKRGMSADACEQPRVIKSS